MKNKKEIEVIKHQHVKQVRGVLEMFGMSHPIEASHKNKATQLSHDVSRILKVEFEDRTTEKAKK